MPTKPYSYKEGFLLGGGLVLLGLAMQFTVSPLDWNFFHAPRNYVTLAVLVLLIAILHILRKESRIAHFLGTLQAAVPSLVFTTLLTALMGLIRQNPSAGEAEGGLGLSDMLTFWPFVLTYVWMTITLGLATLKSAQRLLPLTLKAVAVFLCHLGLFVALTTGTLGNADMQRLKMVCAIGGTEHRVVNEEGLVKQLSVAVELKRFIFEQSEEGAPKRFASDIVIHTRQGEHIPATVEVNRPVKVKGWRIYQFSYDVDAGAESRLSVLEFVRDPWLPAVYAGIYILLAGAILMFFAPKRKRKGGIKL